MRVAHHCRRIYAPALRMALILWLLETTVLFSPDCLNSQVLLESIHRLLLNPCGTLGLIPTRIALICQNAPSSRHYYATRKARHTRAWKASSQSIPAA